jgi:hypothetical protein
MAYYKITLEETTEEQRLQVLRELSQTMNLPIETSGEWRSDRDEPFLQLINEYLYIRHIRRLSAFERTILIGNAQSVVDRFINPTYPHTLDLTDVAVNVNVSIPNKVGSLTFKFFH